jgi:CDP-diglyceride synthetase
MRERILAALVGLLIILPALIFGGQLAAEIVVGLVLLIGLDEYVAMAFPEERRGAFLLLSATGLGIYAAALHGSSGQLVAAVVLSAFAVMLRVLFQDLPVEGAPTASRGTPWASSGSRPSSCFCRCFVALSTAWPWSSSRWA